MSSSVDAARMIDALEEALQSCPRYDRHLQRKIFVDALHKSGFHITPIEQPASNPAWSRLGMPEAEGEVLDEVAGLTAEEPFKVGDRVRITPNFREYVPEAVGVIGIITRIDGSSVPYSVQDEKENFWWCRHEDLERVRVTPIKESKS